MESGGDVIITYGGDGSFIGSERLWPGVPKLGLRPDDTCIKCARHEDAVVIDALKSDDLHIVEMTKLEVLFDGQRQLGLNDVILRNTDPRSAVRFRVLLNGQPVTEELIADGLVVCTPFGSSAYFRSITRTIIRVGLGVAFNNCTDLLHHLVVREDDRLTVEVLRGPLTLAVDNDPDTHDLVEGARLEIGRAPESARVYDAEALRCTECRYRNAPRRRF